MKQKVVRRRFLGGLGAGGLAAAMTVFGKTPVPVLRDLRDGVGLLLRVPGVGGFLPVRVSLG